LPYVDKSYHEMGQSPWFSTLDSANSWADWCNLVLYWTTYGIYVTSLGMGKGCTWLFKLLVALIFLVVLIICLQQVINYLSYDRKGPSAAVVRMLGMAGLEEPLARALYWYVLQIAFSLLLIRLIIRRPFRDVGFNLYNMKSSRTIISLFIPIYTIVVVLAWYGMARIWGVGMILSGVESQTLTYRMKDIAIFSLLPGPGEEPLFRIFVIQFLLMVLYSGKDAEIRVSKVFLIIISSLLFALAHVFVLSFVPLQLKYSVLQVVTSFVLGMVYAYSYLHTKSILAAVVCHNYTDFVVRFGAYLLLGFVGV